jgi:hypothetical protein
MISLDISHPPCSMDCNLNGNIALADHSINIIHNIQLHNTCILATKTRCMDRVIRDETSSNNELYASALFSIQHLSMSDTLPFL